MAFFVIPGRRVPRLMKRFVYREWRQSGYKPGRGDQERGEYESEFSKGISTGAIKVQSTSCRPPYGVLLLIYAPNGPE